MLPTRGRRRPIGSDVWSRPFIRQPGPTANRLYQRLGFRVSGTNYYSLDHDTAKQTVEERPF